jgi:hypothetical protein
VIVWKVPELDARLASVRLRAIHPAIACAAAGRPARVLERIGELDGCEAIVFSGSIGDDDLVLARLANRRGVAVLLDLGDGSGGSGIGDRARREALSRLATMIVVASDEARTDSGLGSAAPLIVVPDPVERRSDLLAALRQAPRRGFQRLFRAAAVALRDPLGAIGARGGRRLMAALRRPRLALRVAALSLAPSLIRAPASGSSPTALLARALHLHGGEGSWTPVADEAARERRVVWIGERGTGRADSGITAVLRAASALLTIARDLPLRLVIVSDDREAYEAMIRPLPIRTEYRDLTALSAMDALAGADACIVPDAGACARTGSPLARSALALAQGVPVVAASSPALQPLKGGLALDDWEVGLRTYLVDAERVRRDVETARRVIVANWSHEAVGLSWTAAIDRAIGAARAAAASRPRRVLLFMHLMQDADLGVPLAVAMAGDGRFEVEVCVTADAVASSPRMLTMLEQAGLRPGIVPRRSVELGEGPPLAGVDAVLTVSETSLAAHLPAHALARRAAASGIATFTLQHGFENPGLNYFAEEGGAPVGFASRRIFTWGEASTVAGATPSEVAARCRIVGCPKPESAAAPPPLPDDGRPVVAVFENLHWSRYDEAFRERFMADLLAAVAAHPAVRFLVKPHHAGRWLTERYQGMLPAAGNLEIVDPAQARWEPYTAPALIGLARGVITTPSTVALDAARLRRPVAVVGYGMALPAYEPLPILRDGADWQQWLAAALLAAPAAEPTAFLGRAILPGDAVGRILAAVREESGAPRSVST